MKKFFKRTLALFLATLTLFSVFSSAGITVFAASDLAAGDTLSVNRDNSARVGYDAPGYKTSLGVEEGQNNYYYHIAQYVVISGTSVLNMRGGPGTSYDVIGVLVSGDKCVYIDEQTVSGTKWYKVEWEQEESRKNSSGKTFPAGTYVGWISSKYGSKSTLLRTRYRYMYEVTTGAPVYCIEYCTPFGSKSYEAENVEDHPVWRALPSEAKDGITLALMYGYPNFNYGVADCDAYAATQALIWEFQMGYRDTEGNRNNDSIYYPAGSISGTASTYTKAGIKGKPAETAYNAIVEKIKEHLTRPSFTKASKAAANNSPIKLNYDTATRKWTVTLTDENSVLSNYKISSKDSNVTVSQDGDKLTITASADSADATQVILKKDIPEDTQSMLAMDNSSGGQTCVLGSLSDPVPAYITLELEEVSTESTLKISKKNEAGAAVANAVYGVYSDEACTNQIATITTDSNGAGTATLEVDAGTKVYVKEISLGTEEAKIYELDTTVHTATMTPDATTTLDVVDEWKPATFSLTKKDNAGNSISGVTFTAYSNSACTTVLKDINGNNVTVTTSNGSAKSTSIDVGTSGKKTIYLKETSMTSAASSKYQMDTTTVYTVTLNAGKNTVVNNGDAIINNLIPGKFSLTKADNYGVKLEGVQFTAYTDSACTTVLKDASGSNVVLTTDANGYAISKDIAITGADGTRKIYVKETKLPTALATSHTMNSTVYTVTLSTNSTVKVNNGNNIINNRKPGKFTLTKVDTNGNKLEGVVFRVYDDAECTVRTKDINGNEITLTTDANGKVTSPEINVSHSSLTRKVYVKEYSLPSSLTSTHTMSTSVITVTFGPGETYSVGEIKNSVKPAKFTLTKTDNLGAPLEGVQFTAYTDSACTTVLKDKNGNNVVVTTNASGVATSAEIAITASSLTRTIYVKETKLPQSSTHTMSTKVYTVSLSAGSTTKVNSGNAIVNNRKPGKFTLTKVDTNGNKLEGVVFRVYDDAACTVRTTDVDGNEITLTTDANGNATSPNINVGHSSGVRKVYVKEYSLPSSLTSTHTMSTAVITVTFGPGETYSIGEVENTVKPAKFTLTKTDNLGAPLEGVKFTAYTDSACTTVLKDKNGNNVVLTTNASGVATSTEIAITAASLKRTIYVKETSSPFSSTHTMDTKVYTVSLTAGSTAKVNSGNAIVNNRKPGKFTLTKVDTNGNKLEGVVFRVYDDAECTVRTKDINGNEITLTTDANGKVTSPEINVSDSSGTRKVFVKEYSLPDDLKGTHTMSTSVITVTFGPGETYSVGEVENTVKPAKFTLTKKDDTGNALKGVQFTAYTDSACTTVLKDKSGANVVLTTDANGVATSTEIAITAASLKRTIYVKETYSPFTSTRTMDTKVYTVSLTAGSTAKVNNGTAIVNNWKPGKFELTKVNSAGKPLENIKFTAYTDAACTSVLKDSAGNAVVLTTDKNGKATSANIKITDASGTRKIYVRETEMPNNLLLSHSMDGTIYTVTISAGKTVKLNNGNPVVNKLRPGLFTIMKKDNTGNFLSGVVFAAYSDEECTIPVKDVNGNDVVITTNNSGFAASNEIPVDEGVHDLDGGRSIWLKEISLPSNLTSTHYMCDEVHKIILCAGTTVPYEKDIINEWIPAKVSIVKGDDTGNKLAGIQFTAYDDEDCTKPIKDVNGNVVILTTDANGYAISDNINVAEGAGHTVDGKRTIYLKETFMPLELTFTHIMDETPIKVVLSASKTTNANSGATVINKWKPAQFSITKYDETNNKLEGATFTAYVDSACSTVLKDMDNKDVVITTDKNGYAISSDIQILMSDGKRTIYVKETAQAAELSSTHHMNDKVFTVTLSAGKCTKVDETAEDNIVGIINEWKDGSFHLTKKNSDGDLMSGVIFDVYSDEGCTKPLKDINGNVIVLTTDNNGFAQSSDIEILDASGTRVVYIKERHIPFYSDKIIPVSTVTYTAVIKAGENVEANDGEPIVNTITHRKARFGLYKENENGDKLAGIKFTAYTDAACTVVAKDINDEPVVITTDVNGYAQSDYISYLATEPSLRLYIKETYVPEAMQAIYKPNTTVYTVDIIAGTIAIANNNAPVINEWKDADLHLTKRETWHNKLLPNTKFGVYSDSACNTLIQEFVTDANGFGKATDIPVNNNGKRTVYVKEISSSDAQLYKINTTVYPVELNAGKDTAVNNDSFIPNEPVLHEIRFKKFDAETGNALAGYRVTVFESVGTAIRAFEPLETDETGYSNSLMLPAGTYTYRESRAPAGYLIDSQTYSFVINKDGTVTGNVVLDADNLTILLGTAAIPSPILVNDKPLSITLNKVDDTQPNTPVEGAEITITQVSDRILELDNVSPSELLNNNELSEPYTDTQYTNANGDVTFTRMPEGTYVYQETKMAPGYHKTDVVYAFTINADGNVITGTTNFTNTPVETVISKTDLCTSEPVPGAEIVISDEAGNEVWREITDEDGTITALALKPGKYTFKETLNPDGYQLNTNSFEFVIGEDNKVVSGVTSFTDAPTEVVISKKDATTAAGVPGAQITIYDANNTVVRTGTTGADGTVTFQYLVPGEYTFVETIAPDGYIINETVFKFTINADGTVTGDNTVTDEQNEVKFTKADVKTGALLPGAKFQIYNETGDLYDTVITGEDGTVTIRKIPVGTYTIVEVEAPDGYTLNEEVHEFSIDKYGVVTGATTVTNAQTQVTITKYDLATNAPLSDADIAIYDSEGKEVARGTTSEDGSFTVYKLVPGTYTFKELSAPVGYGKNPGTYTFVLDEYGNVSGAISLVNKPTEITIKKIDDMTNKPLKGAVIGIYNSDGELVVEKTTDENGIITATHLPVGSYTYKELKAPTGYVLNTSVYKFKIDEFGNVTGDVELLNFPTEVQITKYDITNDNPVANAEITIYNANGEEVYRNYTDDSGLVFAYYLPAGTYTFKETVAPDKYTINTTTFEFTITEDGRVIGNDNISDEPTKVVISKTDLCTSEPVPGAEITIYDVNGGRVYKDVTDENGTITAFYLPHGTYTFKETLAPSTYKLNPNEFTFTIDENGIVTGVTDFTDEPTEVVISKTDLCTSEPVPGAEITIYDADGNEVFKDATDEDGKVTATYLPHGTYTFKETLAPSTYKLNPNTFEFTIHEDGSITGVTNFTDEPTEVVIGKTDLCTSEPVPGAEITIYDADGNEVFKDVTDEDGTINAMYLPHGTYTFKETLAPSTYKLNPNEFEFTIHENGSVTGVTYFTDEPTEVTITKIASDTDLPLSDSDIIIYNSENKVVYDSAVDGSTDENGEITITYLPHGTYTYEECWAPTGYYINPAIFEFTIDDTGAVSGQTTFRNEPTEVTITKVDITDSQPVPGAKIEIFDQYGEKVFEDITGEDGTITAFHLPVGTYTFRETLAPSEYKINPGEFTFSIDSLGNVTGDTVITDEPTEVTFTKVDAETNEVLSDADITIYDASGTDIATLTTGEDGKATYLYLPHGEYTFKETKAPEGYVLNETVYSFIIDENGHFEGDTVIPNTKIYGEIEIGKADAEDDELMLPNAVFDIMNSDGEVIATITTDENGIATAEGIEYGDYTVIEVTAPNGYNINATAFPVSIVYDGETVRVDVRDSVIRGRIEIAKKNSVTLEPVANAEFEVIDSEGNVVETIVTDKDGIATTSLLRYGDYTLHESKAPANYIAGEDVEFAITEEGTVVQITYYETPIVKTGSVATDNTSVRYIILAGIMFIIATGGLTVYGAMSRKKDKKSK